MKKLFLFVAVAFLFLPSLSFAATSIENFDSYTNGASLGGANGGSGWSGAWTIGDGTWTSDTAPAGGQGGLALHSTTTACCNPSASRTFSSISSGVLHFEFNFSDGVTDRLAAFVLQDSANTGGEANINRIALRLNGSSDGEVGVGDGQGSETAIGTFSTSTWTTIDIKFDNALGNVVQVSVNGGSYSSDIASGGSLSHIDTLFVFTDDSSAHDFWVDDISITPPATAITGSGTINRLAKFITGTTIGNALFSDDGTDTTLTSGNLFLQIGSAIDSVTNGVLNFGTTLATTMNFGRTGQKMIINSDVGIGTATPTQKLDVNGGIFSNFLYLLAGGLGIDTNTAGELAIGSTTASSIKIGHTGITTTVPGTLSVGKMTTTANCNSTASPAVCTSAPAGSVALPNGGTTLVVNTTAVTANSQIFIQEDQSLGARLGITCNTGTGRNYVVSARTAGTSFTVKSSNAPVLTKACLSYWVVN